MSATGSERGQLLVLGPAAVGQRCDRAVLAALAAEGHAFTRSQLARAFEAGQVVRVDGPPSAPEQPLRPGAVIQRPLQVRVLVPAPEPLRAEPEPLPLVVIHEDDELLVVDKPAGMVVHAGAGHPRGTLVNAVLHHLGVDASGLPVLPGNDAARPGIVHRLDRDTSGVMIVAKHAAAQLELAAQFRRHSVERQYWALLEGEPTWREREIETGHGRDPNHRRRFAPLTHATRRARSRLRCEAQLAGAAEVTVTLATGRTHQIRMHAAHLGHPVLGDSLYGRPPKDAAVRQVGEQLGRHALHAALLGVVHPRTGELLRWHSPLPPELVAARAALGERCSSP